ncbi:MAG: hypothetical protein JXA20_12260 [Spirochaetes bacterium]|nr:hypothetical protein [Spirochaetota bacterium]
MGKPDHPISLHSCRLTVCILTALCLLDSTYAHHPASNVSRNPTEATLIASMPCSGGYAVTLRYKTPVPMTPAGAIPLSVGISHQRGSFEPVIPSPSNKYPRWTKSTFT